jgi:hypothetical protein
MVNRGKMRAYRITVHVTTAAPLVTTRPARAIGVQAPAGRERGLRRGMRVD